MPENVEPQISYRSFVKLANKTILRQIRPSSSIPQIDKEIQIKKTEQLDLSLPENSKYMEIIEDIKKDIIEVYKSVGINIKGDQFPELILSRKKTKDKNYQYYRRENIAIVTVEDKIRLHDILAIYHELCHGISTRTEIYTLPHNSDHWSRYVLTS
jgi:PHD/YefM family antitoxin component YafN of YafNO toxin-antitoxin module